MTCGCLAFCELGVNHSHHPLRFHSGRGSGKVPPRPAGLLYAVNYFFSYMFFTAHEFLQCFVQWESFQGLHFQCAELQISYGLSCKQGLG